MNAESVRKGVGIVGALAAAWLIVVVAMNMPEPNRQSSLYDVQAKERLGQMVAGIEEGRISKQELLAQLQALATQAREAEAERDRPEGRG
jgi:hypothetical protein